MIDIAFQTEHASWKKTLRHSRAQLTRALQTTFNALELPKRKFSVAVSLTSDAEMQQLNNQYRQKNKPTNVLSFPMIDDFSVLGKIPKAIDIELGDIVLAYETTAREALEQDKTLQDHVSHLLVHGLLHLFGYDHMSKKDAREMEELEIRILAELGIADPYL
jgi:probable rRNA maturation factor